MRRPIVALLALNIVAQLGELGPVMWPTSVDLAYCILLALACRYYQLGLREQN